MKQVACFSLGRSHFSKSFYFCVIPRSNIFNKESWVQTLLVETFHPHSIIIALPILDHRDHRLQKTYATLFILNRTPPPCKSHNHQTHGAIGGLPPSPPKPMISSWKLDFERQPIFPKEWEQFNTCIHRFD